MFYELMSSSVPLFAQEVELDIFLRAWWSDPRLSGIGQTNAQLLDADDMAAFIWTPAMFFLNAKSASYHLITEWNMGLQFKNDSIFSSVRFVHRRGQQVNIVITYYLRDCY